MTLEIEDPNLTPIFVVAGAALAIIVGCIYLYSRTKSDGWIFLAAAILFAGFVGIYEVSLTLALDQVQQALETQGFTHVEVERDLEFTASDPYGDYFAGKIEKVEGGWAVLEYAPIGD